MSKYDVVLYSPVHLEKWGPKNPTGKGIGGSETCHVEMAKELASAGLNVLSLTPLPESEQRYFHNGVQWEDIGRVGEFESPVLINFRDTSIYSQPELSRYEKNWFIAQDVDYYWRAEDIVKVNRYVTLCKEHTLFTGSKYPETRPFLYQSSNGIRSSEIRTRMDKLPLKDPNKIVYTSSPDRGLLPILQNWFRIRELQPDARLEVYYGFDNIDVITSGGGYDHLTRLKHACLALSSQPGVTFHGRIGQRELYDELETAAFWFYPTMWPETSCVTCMEMQAFGVIPICTNFWALSDNVLFGELFDGDPSKSQLVMLSMIRTLSEMMNAGPCIPFREEMSKVICKRFDWKNICKQWLRWIEEDSK